jgi:raffinose/stachyose/melibiose transport system substrate-binding protein
MSLRTAAGRTKSVALGSALVLAMATSGSLVATAGDGPKPATSDSTGSAPATSGEVVWWGWTPGSPVNEEYIAAFNEDYPDIEVTWRQVPIDQYDAAIRPALATGSGLDVYQMSAGSANGGVAVFGPSAIDLTPAVEQALGPDWKDMLSPTGVEALTVDGELKALASGAVFSGIVWINQDLFDEYGLEPPTDWDSWKNVCETFESNDVTCFVQGAAQAGFNIDTIHAIADNVEPGKFVAATRGGVPWTDDSIVEAFSLWKQLFDEGIMQEGALGQMQYPDANNAFMAQDAAMVMMGTWYTTNLVPDVMRAAMEAAGSTDEPFTMLPIDFPDIAGTGNTGSLFGDVDYGQGVSANSSNQDAATTFAVWMGTSEVGQQVIADSLNLIPALKSVTPNWDNIELVNPDVQAEPVKSLIERSSAVTDAPRFATINADMNVALQDALTRVADGTATPEEATADLQEAQESVG